MCELDIIFNFEKAYFIFDEFILGGEVQETSKKSVLKSVNDQDVIQEVRTHRSLSLLDARLLGRIGRETKCSRRSRLGVVSTFEVFYCFLTRKTFLNPLDIINL